jgi:hypothetical protein
MSPASSRLVEPSGMPSTRNGRSRASCTGGRDATAAISIPGMACACAMASRQNATAGAKMRPPSLPVSIT